MKKILSILLAMLMLVSVLLVAPVSVGAAESTPITVYFENNWLWSDVFYHTWGSSYYPDTEWEKGEVKLVGTSVNGHEVYKATMGIDATGILFAGLKDDGTGTIDQTPDITEGFYDGACYSMTWDNGNAVVVNDIADIYPDYVDSEEEPVSTPDSVPTDGYTFYFVDHVDNFAEVYAYAWNEGATHDEPETIKMEPTGEVLSEKADQAGGLVYSVTFDEKYLCIKFNGNSEVGGEVSGETATLNFEDGIGQYLYWGNEFWYNSIEELEEENSYQKPSEEPEGEFITVYFQNNWLWSDVCCYFEGSAYAECDTWPGTPMEFFDYDGNYDVYYAEVPADASFIIFNGFKDDGSGERDQTPDIESFSNNDCYYMLWDNGNTTGCEDISVIFPDYDFGGEEESKAEFAGTSAELKGNIIFKLYFDITDDIFYDSDAKVVITTHEGTIEYAASEGVCNDETVYSYSVSMPAKNMTTTITAQVITDLVETEVAETSVQEYLVGILSMPGEYRAEQDIAKAMLNYGTAAQLYFDYNTDKLANDTEYMTEEEKTVATADLSAYAPKVEGTNDGMVQFYGATLTLKSETTLKLYFKVENADASENVAIQINGMTAGLTPNGNLYELTIPELYAQHLDDPYTAASDCVSVDYSALSYAYLAQQSSNPDLVNLANALAAYHRAACDYIGL